MGGRAGEQVDGKMDKTDMDFFGTCDDRDFLQFLM
jgi:hypothetical protein